MELGILGKEYQEQYVPLEYNDLIKKAEEYAEQLELEKSVALYEDGLTRFPNDTTILDHYSELLI